MKTDWSHIRLLGWYDRKGNAYLVPWSDTRPTVRVVVTGIQEAEMPLLDIPVPKRARLQAVPEDKNPYEYAKEADGFYAVGVYVEEGFERTRP